MRWYWGQGANLHPKRKILLHEGKESFGMRGRMSAWGLCGQEGLVEGEAASKRAGAEVIDGH